MSKIGPPDMDRCTSKIITASSLCTAAPNNTLNLMFTEMYKSAKLAI
jgi:hypothetical protein